MTKGRKVKGRLEARRKAFDAKPSNANGFQTHRPGSNKKTWPKTMTRGTARRSHGAK